MAAQETTDSRSIAYPEHQNKQGWILTFFDRVSVKPETWTTLVAGSLLLLPSVSLGVGAGANVSVASVFYRASTYMCP